MLSTSIIGLTVSSGLFVPTSAEKGAAFLPFDPTTFSSQLFWLVVTFGALFFLMSRVALPRIGEVIEERRDRIQRDLDEAARLKSETDAALKAYEDAMAEARSKAQALARETREKLAAQTDAERHRVEEQLATKIAETEKRIEATKDRAMASVNDIAADTAVAVVRALTGKDVTADEARKALAGTQAT